MKWVRRIFVYLLSIVLLASLLGAALAISIQVGLSHPSKIEDWLDQSNLYNNLVTTITDQAQTAIENNVSGGASINSTVVRQAAHSAFPQSLLKQSVQTFLNSNYAWLEGKTATPNFRIDLSGAKQAFATQVADASVLTHLTSLPVCTAAQALQLQSANPLLLSCRPPEVSAQTEAAQISQQVASNTGFLSNPVVTASTLGTKVQSGNQPYYERLSKLPKVYQGIEKLPWALSVLSVLSIIGIIFCSRSKRLGIRRVGIVLLVGGILLVIDKLLTDAAFNKLKDQAFNGVNNAQIQQSLTSFAHYVEAELVKIDLWFGIVYIVLAVILLGTLILTRNRTPKLSSEAKKAAVPAHDSYETAQPQRQPDRNAINPHTRTGRPTQTPHLEPQNPKKRSGPRPPRLIQ